MDIGANVAVFSIVVAAGTHARVFAFEPVLSTFNDLVRNISLNPSMRIIPFIIALSNTNDDVDMIAVDSSGINRVLSASGRAQATSEGLPIRRVPTVTLDEFASVLPIYKAHKLVIKIDVERHEMEVLEGASKAFLLRSVPIAICVEVDTNHLTIEELLLGIGYQKMPYRSGEHDHFYANSHWVANTSV